MALVFGKDKKILRDIWSQGNSGSCQPIVLLSLFNPSFLEQLQWIEEQRYSLIVKSFFL